MPLLPPLPPRESQLASSWSLNVSNAYSIIHDAYTIGTRLIEQARDDPLRLRIHMENILNNIIPVLMALETSAEEEGLPLDWIKAVAEAMGELVVRLRTAQIGADGIDNSKVNHIEPITVTRTGRRGRPRKIIDLEYLQEAMSPQRRITVKKLAEICGVHRNTMRYYLKLYNVDYNFTALTDVDLDRLVKTFRRDKPQSGIRYLIGFLRRHGLQIQKARVRASIRRVDGLGRVLRERVTVQRWKYKVARPNALWHIDGHHKLILWGIVIHGIVDGYCRTVTGLRASDNNRALTVLDVFLDAVNRYGMPSRMRGDRGGENKQVSVFMILYRGPNRASFIWGSSTHNTRIERLWVEVGTQFARSWRGFFFRLERMHSLDRSNAFHLWLLQYLFLPMINFDDCRNFQEVWNAHPISGEGHDRSPNDMRLVGLTEHGVYADECASIHPDTIERYYGTHGRPAVRRPDQTGAGHPPDEEEPLGDRVASDVETHIHHDAVEVPQAADPFADITQEAAFYRLLEIVKAEGHIPSGYGCHPHEWDDTHYPAFESIRSGRRGKKSI